MKSRMSEAASAWARLRLARFKFDSYECATCGKSGTAAELEAQYRGPVKGNYRYRSGVGLKEIVTVCVECFLRSEMPHESPETRELVASVKSLLT